MTRKDINPKIADDRVLSFLFEFFFVLENSAPSRCHKETARLKKRPVTRMDVRYSM
jgi:hypothetical protein